MRTKTRQKKKTPKIKRFTGKLAKYKLEIGDKHCRFPIFQNCSGTQVESTFYNVFVLTFLGSSIKTRPLLFDSHSQRHKENENNYAAQNNVT